MFNVSNLFKQYIVQHDREFEIRAIIGATTYNNDTVIEFDVDDSIIPSEDFTIGTVICARLNLSLRTNDIIPTNAKVSPEVKLKGQSGDTEWVPLGSFYIDNRSFKDGVWKFTCYDKLIITEQTFVSALNYPNTMQAAFNEIVGQLGLQTVGIIINPAYQIPYKDEDITIREMLSYIASAHASSVKLTRDEKLTFVKFNSDTIVKEINASDYFDAEQTNPLKTYTKIILTYNTDGETLTVGSGGADNTLAFYNPFMTEQMLNTIFQQINGFNYVPFAMGWKGTPELECGDKIKINLRNGTNITSRILTNKMSFKGGLKSVMTAPSISEQRSEFDLKGSLRKLKNVTSGLQEDTPYYGVTIGRANGLKIERSDGKSRAIFNSDKFSMQAQDEQGVMRDRIYFDPVAGKYIFDGTLTAETIEALKAQIDIVISNTTIVQNLYAQKGTIAELTVDELDTSDKVQNYLNQSIEDVNYIRAYDQTIDFMEAKTDGSQTEQMRDRNGNLVYWVDGNHEGTTNEETEFPVMVYKYSEGVKMRIHHYLDPVTNYYIPRIVMGVGTGNQLHKDYGKGFIYKDELGLCLEYITSFGVKRFIRLGEQGFDGISCDITDIQIYNNGMFVTYGDLSKEEYTFEKDGSGKIVYVRNEDTGINTTIGWYGGNK